MNTKRNYKFVNLTHAYSAYDEAIKTQAELLSMLERVTSEYNALGRVVDPVLGANNSTISEARQLIAKVKGGSMKLTICKSPNGAVALRSDRGQVCEMLAGYDQTRLQDAQTIAHRVNCHDELVAALRDIQRVIDCGESGAAEMAAMLLHIGRQCDAALERAKQ